jgi:hypothetical protein
MRDFLQATHPTTVYPELVTRPFLARQFFREEINPAQLVCSFFAAVDEGRGVLTSGERLVSCGGPLLFRQ